MIKKQKYKEQYDKTNFRLMLAFGILFLTVGVGQTILTFTNAWWFIIGAIGSFALGGLFTVGALIVLLSD